MTYQASISSQSAPLPITYFEKLQLTNDAWNPTQNRKTDVDQEVGTASRFEEDGQGRYEDGYDVGEDI